MSHEHIKNQIEVDGYSMTEPLLGRVELDVWIREIERAMETHTDSTLLRASNERSISVAYGSRNLLTICPKIKELLQIPALFDLCSSILGSEWGCVRGLFFDKPPGASWSLPWHQDLTIAVADLPTSGLQRGNGTIRDNSSEPSEGFSKPTRKAGVCHVEAPAWLLERMLTVRLHLDPMGSKNGAVTVRPGTHRYGKLMENNGVSPDNTRTLTAQAGSVMLMRPLLSHASIPCEPGHTGHRRIVHLELSPNPELPEGFRWNQFLPIESPDFS